MARAARTLSGFVSIGQVVEAGGPDGAADLASGQSVAGDDHVVGVRFVLLDAGRLRAQEPVQPRDARRAAGQVGAERHEQGRQAAWTG